MDQIYRMFLQYLYAFAYRWPQSIKQIARSIYEVKSHIYLVLIPYLQWIRSPKWISRWFVSRATRNKFAHAMTGNGAPGGRKGNSKGKGKGKVSEPASSNYATGPLQTPLPADNQLQAVKQAVLSVLPEAARLRAQSTLVESEWTVPVFHHQPLGKQPGIAVVPKHSLASVTQQVGFTSHSVAVIVTENPDNLGLRGCVREKVNCLFSVMGDDRVSTETVVTRQLVQLGFGSSVAQAMMGQQVDMLTTMKRMQIKLPERLGWPAGPFPASIIMHELEQIAPSHAIDDIICRQGDTATFLVHGSYVDTFLKASGKRSTFLKIVQDTSDFEVLWVEEGVSIDDAIKLSDHEDAYGVVSKGKSSFTRFAIIS